jgi:DNA-binding NtrC family response regulator
MSPNELPLPPSEENSRGTLLESDTRELAPPLPSTDHFGRTIGASVAMRKLYPLCERLAKARIPVLIQGETGTGKEVLAESLHEASGSTGPFVVLDCTTVAPTLFEAALFGHERGAFTGAVASRPSVFEEADGGTLLIDEIGDLGLPLQAKLLRVLDTGRFRRVGGQQTIQVNVRVLAATRRDLDAAVARGLFRDDLYHRLAVGRIELPPLRDRGEDIVMLAQSFAREMGGGALPAEVLTRLRQYAWPGNVRELRNAVACYLALGEAGLDTALVSQLGESKKITRNTEAELFSLPFSVARKRAAADFERRYLEHVLAVHGGNVVQAARASGLALRYFRMVKARSKAARPNEQ